jgi:hypothetical protein
MQQYSKMTTAVSEVSQSKNLTLSKKSLTTSNATLNAIIKTKQGLCIRQIIQANQSDVILTAIVKVASMYGNKEPISDDIKSECLNILKERFQALGVHEILLAYRMASLGDFGELANGKMYNGQFNNENFAAVMQAYVKRSRNDALKDYHKLEAVQKKSDERLRIEQKKAAYDKAFPGMIEAHKGCEIDKVVSAWYDTAIRLGLIQEPGREEKLEYFASAKIEYFEGLESSKVFNENPFKVMANKSFRNKTEQSTIANLAKRRIVHDKLLRL